MALIRTHDLVKDFGDTRAVDHVSLTVDAGEVVGLVGANGAGKTTLIRLLLGLLQPSAGQVELLGGPPDRSTRRGLGYMPQGLGLYTDLTVAENLSFQAAVYGDTMPVGDELAAVVDVLVDDLALGMKRQTAFAAALGHRPKVLVLDEPTSGVGPLGRADLWDTIHEAADAGVAVLVTTHYMDEAAQCDRLVIMAHGQQVATGTPSGIVGDLTVAEVATPDPTALRRLEDAGFTVLPSSGSLRVITDDEAALARALQDAPANPGSLQGPAASPDAVRQPAADSGAERDEAIEPVRITRHPATLEEAFIVAVGSARVPA